MANPKFKLGPATTRPADFHPNKVVHYHGQAYRVDVRQRVAERAPWDDDGSGGFFKLVTTDRVQPKPAKPDLRQTLIRGIAIPALAIGVLVGLFLVIYPFFPRLTFKVQKQISGYSNNSAIAAIDPTHNRLVIPKIGVDTPIVEGPNLNVLNKHEGVWHQRGAIVSDNFVLAGHRFRYLPPNTTTFYNLSQLQAGDTVVVDWYGKRYEYDVVSNTRVNQSNSTILAPTPDTQLTLYTCYDKRQTERIVVVAKLAP